MKRILAILVIFIMLAAISPASAGYGSDRDKNPNHWNHGKGWDHGNHGNHGKPWDHGNHGKPCGPGEPGSCGDCGSSCGCGDCGGCGNCGGNGTHEIPEDNNSVDPGIPEDNTSVDPGEPVDPEIPEDPEGNTSVDPGEFETVRLCKNNICNVGGDGEVLELTNYKNATNPTYDQLVDFLRENKVDEMKYSSSFVCSDFAEALHNDAEAAGIRAGWVGLEGCNHACNIFETTDRGVVYIDCTGTPAGGTLQDKELEIEIGGPLKGKYLFKDYPVNMGCNLKELLIFW